MRAIITWQDSGLKSGVVLTRVVSEIDALTEDIFWDVPEGEPRIGFNYCGFLEGYSLAEKILIVLSQEFRANSEITISGWEFHRYVGRAQRLESAINFATERLKETRRLFPFKRLALIRKALELAVKAE
ncbi:MAG: hypothetical protein Q7S75_00900 [bacterium]|nr:hypothetical protein [bacterium]